MAVHYGVAGVRQLITGVRLGVIEFPAPVACRLNRLFMRISVANDEGDTFFDLKVNDASIYGSPALRPKILIGETTSESFPSVELQEGDMVTVDVVAAPLGGVSGLYVLVQLQDAPVVTQYIKDAYNGALDRNPDSGELSAAETDLGSACAAGTTLAQTNVFFDDLFNSAEYVALATSDAVYIEDLYQAILGRPSDPGGFAFWFDQLDSETLTREAIRDSFNGCTEHVNSRLSGWCPNTLPFGNAVALQGVPVSDADPETGQALVFDGAEWVPTDQGGSSVPFVLVVAISDEATAITTGVAKITFRMPAAVHITEVRASLSVVSSSGNPAFDVNKNGTTIFTTVLTVDATEKTSATAAAPAVLDDDPTDFAADDEVTIDIDAAGTGAMGAKITFVGTYQ